MQQRGAAGLEGGGEAARQFEGLDSNGAESEAGRGAGHLVCSSGGGGRGSHCAPGGPALSPFAVHVPSQPSQPPPVSPVFIHLYRNGCGRRNFRKAVLLAHVLVGKG